MAAGQARTTDVEDRLEVRRLADEGHSIEVIARAVARSRYFVETTLDRAPAGRNDVPYRYRAIRAGADVAARYRARETAEQIARAIGVSTTTVYDWLRADGLQLRGKSGRHALSFESVLTREFLAAEYTAAGRAASDIAQEVGCSEPTVRNWMRRHQIAVRPMSARKRAYVLPATLLDDIAQGRSTLDATAAAVGCSRSQVLRALRRSGHDLPRDRRPPLTEQLLLELYVAQRMSCPQIATRTGWAQLTVRERLKAYGIARRLGPPPRTTD